MKALSSSPVDVLQWLLKHSLGHPYYCDSCLLAAYINDDDIRSDLPDVLVGDDNVRIGTEDIEKFISAGNDDLADLSAAMVKFKIGNPTELFTVA